MKNYIIWFSVYFIITWFMLGATPAGFLITAAVYGVSVLIALSPIGERILRFAEGVKRPATRKDKEYLIPLFRDVYREAKTQDRKISRDIQIYIIDKNTVNAFAFGRNTVCVTKGAVELFDEDELKAVIAHELGHIAHGDTKALLLNTVGNGIFTVFMLGMRVTFFVLDVMSTMTDGLAPLKLFAGLSKLLLDAMILAFMSLGHIIMAIDSRNSEYRADHFAFTLGYGSDLISVLETLDKISITGRLSLIDRLKQSHPHITYRIERLEQLEAEREKKRNRIALIRRSVK